MMKKTSLFYITILGLFCCIQNSAAKEFKVKHQNLLAPDGPDVGLDSYALIRQQYGEKAIESPDRW